MNWLFWRSKKEEKQSETKEILERGHIQMPLGDDAPLSPRELKRMTDVDPTLDWLLKNRASKGYKD